MNLHNSKESPELPSGRDGVPRAAADAPNSHSRSDMSCGMGKNPMSMMLAALVGIAFGALLFVGGGGIANNAQASSWTFLLFLVPCLLMFGAMMMMGNKSGPNGGL